MKSKFYFLLSRVFAKARHLFAKLEIYCQLRENVCLINWVRCSKLTPTQKLDTYKELGIIFDKYR